MIEQFPGVRKLIDAPGLHASYTQTILLVPVNGSFMLHERKEYISYILPIGSIFTHRSPSPLP